MAVHRSKSYLFVLVLLLLVVGMDRGAEADSTSSKPSVHEFQQWSAPWAVALHSGIATPYGLAGVELERTLHPWVTVALGGGQGFSGAQVAGSLRLRTLLGPMALGLGVGPGFGDSDSFSTKGERTLHHSNAVWLNAEVHAELRMAAGLLLRSYAGVTTTISSNCNDGASGTGPTCATDPNLTFPVLGVAVGYAFGG